MNRIQELVLRLREQGEELEFFGSQSSTAIDKLQDGLKAKLSTSFREFLLDYGGGGRIGDGISGIWKNEPFTLNRGTVYGDTLRTRREAGLPEELIVVYRNDDTFSTWCLDTSKMYDGECPIVAYPLIHKGKGGLVKLFDSFEEYCFDYLHQMLE